MFNTSRKLPTSEDQERSVRLREVVGALCEVNRKVPVIVEGRRDVGALRHLGLIGEVLVLHNGRSLYDVCEEVAECFPKVVILLDWDDKGEDLFKRVAQHLSGHWEDFGALRGMLKALCQKDIKDVEGIPKLLRRLEGCEHSR